VYWVVTLSFLYIAILVPVRLLQRWWCQGEIPLASLANPHPSRGMALADRLVQQGLIVWWISQVAWIRHPEWWLAYPHISGIAETSAPLGAGLLLVSAVVLTIGNLSLGRSWWMGILEEPQPLVQTGAFAHVRHPIYLAMLLYFLAAALLMPTLWILPSQTLACAGVLSLGALEEDYWLRHHPEEYAEQMRRTNAYLPVKSLLRFLLGR
jgi:protein-S-isoprenylcysteine O-methyltransferase Ste14